MAKSSNITIKKVKCVTDGKENCIRVDYRLSRNNIDDELTGLFREAAAPEFYEAFAGLREHVEEILEIYGKGLGGRIKPYGVTYHYSKDGTMGAIISSKFMLPNAETCIVLNTPMRKAYSDNETGEPILTEEATKALWAVEMETRKYVEGKRAQMNLFGDTDENAPYTSQDVGNNDESGDCSGDDKEGQGEEISAVRSAPVSAVGAKRGATIVDIGQIAAAVG